MHLNISVVCGFENENESDYPNDRHKRLVLDPGQIQEMGEILEVVHKH